MKLKIAPNDMCDREQTLNVKKVAVLIGENGSGKSLILQSIFNQKLNGRDHEDLRVVCISSGQNENYSQDFHQFNKGKEFELGDGFNRNCFYHDKTWSKTSIFLAASLRPDGYVSRLLREFGYVDKSAQKAQKSKDKSESSKNTDMKVSSDISTVMKFKLEINEDYRKKVLEDRKNVSEGKELIIKNQDFLQVLGSFVKLKKKNYNFTEKFSEEMEVSAKEMFEFPIDIAVQSGSDVHELVGSDPEQEVIRKINFLTQAVHNDSFIKRNDIELEFKGLELDLLSDGEYQILFILALIDLFDSEKTLFLIDEADSHLHYSNIIKLWAILKEIKGYVITTTHLIDTITSQDIAIEDIHLIENWEIVVNKQKLNKLLDRITGLTRFNSTKFEVCSKYKNIVLMDNPNDWLIFKKLASRKGLDTRALSHVKAIGVSSTYDSIFQSFGKEKIDWLHDFKNEVPNIKTKNVFLICDRDEAPLMWKNKGVEVCNGIDNLIGEFTDNSGNHVKTHLLAWKRREVKHYLLSYSALSHFGVLDQINKHFPCGEYLTKGNPCDYNSIQSLKSKIVKDVLSPLINIELEGMSEEKLDQYISKIHPDEISDDIVHLYEFLIRMIKNVN